MKMNEIAKVLNNHKVLINMQVGHNLIANKRVGPNNCVCRNFLKNIPGATFMPESSVHQFFFCLCEKVGKPYSKVLNNHTAPLLVLRFFSYQDAPQLYKKLRIFLP